MFTWLLLDIGGSSQTGSETGATLLLDTQESQQTPTVRVSHG
jgi:hypothetical protein